MPDLTGFRTLSRLLALKARLEVADGKVTDAIDTMRIGLTTARDLGRTDPPHVSYYKRHIFFCTNRREDGRQEGGPDRC